MHNLTQEYYKGIQGVKLIDSGIAGPVIGISACTHGGEHAGLKVMDHLVQESGILQNITCGKVFLILSNIRAYELSLASSHPADARFIEENLNRCCTEEKMIEGQSHEARRAKELESVLSLLDYHLDIHSTYSKSEAIGIVTPKGGELMSEVLNVDVIYENLTGVLRGKALLDITERHAGIGIGLEAGCEMDNTGFHIGVENSLRLLHHLQMIDSDCIDLAQYKDKKNERIYIHGSIVPEGKNFQTTKAFQHNDIVQKGELIGWDETTEYRASETSVIIMPSVLEKLNILIEKGQIEEYCFLGRKSSR